MAETVLVIDPGDLTAIALEERAPVGASGPPFALNEDHEAQALSARTEDYRNLPRFAELVRVFCAQVQDVEDAIWALALDSVETAIGAQLDGFGAVVGAERQGLSDDDYRALILATILASDSEGTIPDLYAIVAAALSSTATDIASVAVYPPAGFVLDVLEPPAFLGRILHGLLSRGTAAGVRGITKVSAEPRGTRLRFSSSVDFPTFAAATGLDDSADPGSGGTLVAAYDERTG